MTTPNLPLHLSLTGRPLALYPAVVPELSRRLQASYDSKTASITDRLLRREPKEQTPAAAAVPSSRVALAAVQQPVRRESYLEIISIDGPLLNKAYLFGSTVCIDGYDRIEEALASAVNDPDCEGVLLDIDSPGGMVSGCFELSDKIAEFAKQKPIVAFTSGLMCSAAYALACRSTEIHGQMSAMIGSIGVIFGRYDYTSKNEKEGIKIDFIKSGEKKTYGHPDTQMDDAELKAHQAEIDKLAGWFWDRVAAGRDLTPEAVAALQADTFLGDDAVTNGLSDGVCDFNSALARLTDLVQNPKQGGEPTSASSNSEPKKVPNTATPVAPQSTTQENPMSNMNRAARRASLKAKVSTLAVTMCLMTAAASAFAEDDISKMAKAETEEKIDAMDDDEVEAMDDEDIDAMDDDENTEAMDEDDLEAIDEDEGKEDDVKSAASRVSHSVMASLAAPKKSAAKPSKSAKAAKPSDRMAVAEQILALPEAKGRESHARTLAFRTEMSVDEARASLTADKSKSGTGSRMKNVPDPKIGNGGGKGGKSAAKAADAALMAAADKIRAKAGQ